MTVVGLTTTNPRDVIEKLSDIQISDYFGVDYDSLLELL